MGRPHCSQTCPPTCLSFVSCLRPSQATEAQGQEKAEEAAAQQQAAAKEAAAGAEQLRQQLEEAQRQLAGAREELKRKAEQLEGAGGQAKAEHDRLWGEVQGRAYDDSLLFRRWLEANASALAADWAARLARARAQRGIVVPAGGDWSGPVVNAFASLYLTRHHLKCALPAVVAYWGANEGVSGEVQRVFKVRAARCTRSHSGGLLGHLVAEPAFFSSCWVGCRSRRWRGQCPRRRARPPFRPQPKRCARSPPQEHIPDVEFLDLAALPYPSYHRPLWFGG